MSHKSVACFAAVVLALAIVGVIGFLSVRTSETSADRTEDVSTNPQTRIADVVPQTPSAVGEVRAPSEPERDRAEEASDDEDESEDAARLSPAETAAVEAFETLVDKWMESEKGNVTMADVTTFVAAFRKVPEVRRDEEIHRALNLVPDENVMLLAGVLMDKSMPKEIVETVFNDILNRNEAVKGPILREVFKDKTHLCWADAAWILDVTGEVPAAARP